MVVTKHFTGTILLSLMLTNNIPVLILMPVPNRLMLLLHKIWFSVSKIRYQNVSGLAFYLDHLNKTTARKLLLPKQK